MSKILQIMLLFLVSIVNATISKGNAHFIKSQAFTSKTILACTYNKCSGHCMPQAATYGFSYDTSKCYCYPVGAYMLTASTCFACKAYTMCDTRPVVINSGST